MAGKINLEFQKALEKKRILHFSKGKALIKKELEAAKDDLNEAKDRLKSE
jgi:chaperonin cofactor prefoldin